jgi:hypothetical protein
MREALAAVEEAVGLRERLAAQGVAIHRWELANSLLLRGRFHTILGDVAAGADDLRRAVAIIGALGPGAADLRAQVELNQRLLRMRGAG